MNEPTIEDVLTKLGELQQQIFDHVEYVEDWRVLPIEDAREHYWAVDLADANWVKFSEKREALEYWLANDDWGPHRNVYENAIYTQRFLPKWVYRGKVLTMVVADTHTDGNKILQIFRTDREVKHGK